MTDSRALKPRPSPLTLLKPGELIDVVETTPLTLNDRRTFNLLINAAWDRLAEPIEHRISLAELRGSHESNDRVGASIRKLMSAIVEVRIEKDGKPATQRVQLLGANAQQDDKQGLLYYRFPEEMRALLSQSRIFARLQREVMFVLSSKYALALYEMIQKRGNLDYVTSETFPTEALRNLLGVPDGKLPRYANFKAEALTPAVEEVSALSDYRVSFAETKKGRKITDITLSWWRKSPEEMKEAFTELKRHSAGRKARLKGQAEKPLA